MFDLAGKAAENLQLIRKNKPLIHNITNFVAMNFTANVFLAMGASPVMAHAENEVEEMVASSLAFFGLAGLRKIRAAVKLPLVGIGGINVANAAEVLQAGADGKRRPLVSMVVNLCLHGGAPAVIIDGMIQT